MPHMQYNYHSALNDDQCQQMMDTNLMKRVADNMWKIDLRDVRLKLIDFHYIYLKFVFNKGFAHDDVLDNDAFEEI